MKKQKRNFKGVWIPKEIWLSEELTLQEKVMIVEIDSLDNEKGCFANNEYFSQFFGISKTRVSEIINSLVKKNYIKSNVLEDLGNKRVLKISEEGLKLFRRGSSRKVEEGLKDSFKHSNTVNNIINNTINKSEETKVSTPKQIAENFFMIYELPEDQVLDEVKEIVFNLREKYGKEVDIEIKKFISYWTEPTPSGKKQRWEIEKTFEVKRRLITWLSRANKFSGQSNDRVIIGLDI